MEFKRRKKSVLIVEDEIIIALDIKLTVKNLGFSISGIFSSGEESIAKISKISPDIILMDVKLSGEIDGVCTAKKIYNKYNIPSIFLTAYNDERTLKRIQENELFFHINKPFSEYELSDTIKRTQEKFGLF